MDFHWGQSKRFFQNISYPLIFLILCWLSYGLLLPFIGFYLDDWYLIWFKHVFGAVDWIKYFSVDRPLMGYYYIVANFMLGGSEKPLAWQIFGVFTRWASVVALWQMLNTIWPDAKRQNTCVALLVTVFPGFTQQWIAAIYSFFFTCLAGFFFSVTLMLKAVRSSRRFWVYYLSSLLIMAYVIPASEFYFGLELIRLLILWFEFHKDENKLSICFKKVAVYGSPYVAILALFLIWRVFLFNSTNHTLALKNWAAGGIAQALGQNLAYFYQAIIDATVNTWGNVFNLINYPSKGVMTFVILGLVILVFLAVFTWLRMTKASTGEMEGIARWRRQTPVLGLMSMVFAILPFWSAQLPIGYKFPYDRFLLAFIFGSCLIVVWLFESLGFNDVKTILVVALLVSVGMGYQIANANRFKNIWDMQTHFLWQLDWRMPGLAPKTTLLAYQLPETDLWSGHALSAFLNWTYAGAVVDRRVDYQFILINSGQAKDIPDLRPNQPIQINFRTYSFEGNTTQAIFIYDSTVGCLRVLDAKITPPETVVESVAQADANTDDPLVLDTVNGAKLTDLNLIINGHGSHPPVQIIGQEPKKDWCYYFEKAELARQGQDYQQVVSLYKQALNDRLTPLNPTESYPFIDALARMGDWVAAEKMTTELMPVTSQALKAGLCHVWKTLSSDFTGQQPARRVLAGLNCP